MIRCAEKNLSAIMPTKKGEIMVAIAKRRVSLTNAVVEFLFSLKCSPIYVHHS
jgi:hypothetical protein